VFSYVLGMSPRVRVHNQIASSLISKRWVGACLQTTNSFDVVSERQRERERHCFVRQFYSVASQYSFALELSICIDLICG
jgi:hypothetical protein